ncbi:MAG: hypothetical protein FWC94_06635 [Bacteroidales bacterium]|nr:hypothetical protein [Bacteroidales bacterium]
MEANNNNKKLKTLRWIIVALILLFAASMVIMIFTMRQRSETFAQNLLMQGELTQLMLEHETIRQENLQFQAELTEKDSIILANSAEIQRLIVQQADYRRIRRQLELLRNITQDYVRRIDSLIVVNEELALQNQEIRQELTAERQRSRALAQDRDRLDDKVAIAASTLRAYNLRAYALRVRGTNQTITDRAARADRINVEFTLGENRIIQAGPRSIYVRIARPDNVIILAGLGDQYTFMLDEDQLQFTIREEIVYDNTAQSIRTSWSQRDPSQPAMAGVYTVTVFMDGQEIGQTFFELR